MLSHYTSHPTKTLQELLEQKNIENTLREAQEIRPTLLKKYIETKERILRKKQNLCIHLVDLSALGLVGITSLGLANPEIKEAYNTEIIGPVLGALTIGSSLIGVKYINALEHFKTLAEPYKIKK